ncbi:MAG: N-acetylneuraminate lyase [Oscillospiraceae bacterium]|nr:N-acetylneuraminate lyase [Oscillospiraceae bacterium]
MKDISKYQGIIPAFYACYDEKGDISPKAVQDLTRFLVKKGVKGTYVGGSSGECIYQSVEERKLVLENVMEAAGGKLTVIAHVGCNSTRDSVELARHAESVGVDAIASIPPIYFKLPEYAIAQYWNDMSAAAPKTDFVIYNIPQLAGVALTMSLFHEMLKNPQVVAVKNSSMPVQDIQMFKADGTAARGENGFVVFNGPDEQFISGRMMGADGGIGGTYGAMPELFLKLDELFKDGKWEEAKALQYDINEVIYALCACKGNMYGVIKAVLKKREGLDLGGVRAPLYNLIPDDMPKVDHAAALIDAAMGKWVK